ncbi:hypothetical protein, variant 1 [Aphanomyces invadans]|uniref:RING-type E3 ubiquitin transferase n=1 Tax=Aphanomyces invadans TaxID=157072 RepID=A0A024TDA2_9STRA|nr:hypothetical protein, variant 1 [Aphanomyces invadans]ETV91964.1 hypothetical protein, variant 1 [Aphanomyces invadans]|eukprot:XP_008879388.1 hypothetical protein, variant 1 [Aphanomyces invadans]
MEQALRMKEKGNECFAKQKYASAIDYYTEAICLQSNVAAFYTNRALCYIYLEKWVPAQTDCRRAIEIDGSNAKAHYLLGKSLCQDHEYDASIDAYEKAQSVLDGHPSQQKASSFAQDVLAGLRLAKKLKWQAAHDAQRRRHNQVMSLFQTIVDQSRTHELKCLPDVDTALVHSNHDTVLAHMMELLEMHQSTELTQVPESFICPIGMDIMADPVTTPNGVSYERKWIEAHIARSQLDPLTREALRVHQLRPNVSLRHAIEDFLNKS